MFQAKILEYHGSLLPNAICDIISLHVREILLKAAAVLKLYIAICDCSVYLYFPDYSVTVKIKGLIVFFYYFLNYRYRVETTAAIKNYKC